MPHELKHRTDPTPALRIVHLLGGLRAFDFGEDFVEVGVDGLPRTMRFTRPPYGRLYALLEKQELQPVGVQFIQSPDDAKGLEAPEWCAWRSPIGFGTMNISREWANVRSQKGREGATDVSFIASKITTYLRLLNLRLQHLSDAYHLMLRAKLRRRADDPPVAPVRFTNLWAYTVDAAIHAYLADAASLRDALSEAMWRLVLKRTDKDVLSLAGLIKHAKTEQHPLLVNTLEATNEGGWIKNLTDLRNEVIHVVPVGDVHEHSYFDLRLHSRHSAGGVHYLHYPFTTENWALRKNVRRGVDYFNDETIRRSIEQYDEFAKTSGDALEYAWRTLGKLAQLAHDVRESAGVAAPMPHFTDDDIVPGSLRIQRGHDQ